MSDHARDNHCRAGSFFIPVIKSQTVTGRLRIEAECASHARRLVREAMEERSIDIADPRIQWDTPRYVDFSFDLDEHENTAADSFSMPGPNHPACVNS